MSSTFKSGFVQSFTNQALDFNILWHNITSFICPSIWSGHAERGPDTNFKRHHCHHLLPPPITAFCSCPCTALQTRWIQAPRCTAFLVLVCSASREVRTAHQSGFSPWLSLWLHTHTSYYLTVTNTEGIGSDRAFLPIQALGVNAEVLEQQFHFCELLLSVKEITWWGGVELAFLMIGSENASSVQSLSISNFLIVNAWGIFLLHSRATCCGEVCMLACKQISPLSIKCLYQNCFDNLLSRW